MWKLWRINYPGVSSEEQEAWWSWKLEKVGSKKQMRGFEDISRWSRVFVQAANAYWAHTGAHSIDRATAGNKGTWPWPSGNLKSSAEVRLEENIDESAKFWTALPCPVTLRRHSAGKIKPQIFQTKKSWHDPACQIFSVIYLPKCGNFFATWQ